MSLSLRDNPFLHVASDVSVPAGASWLSDPIDPRAVSDLYVGWMMGCASSTASADLEAHLSMDGENYVKKIDLATAWTTVSGDSLNPAGGMAKLTGYKVRGLRIKAKNLAAAAAETWNIWVSGE